MVQFLSTRLERIGVLKRIFSPRSWWRRADRLWDTLFAYRDGGWQSVRRSLKLLPGRLASAFRTRRSTQRPRYVPAFEVLESRVVPATPVLSVSVNSFSPTENTPFSGTVATATGLTSGGSYSATIVWRDATSPSPGITAPGGSSNLPSTPPHPADIPF